MTKGSVRFFWYVTKVRFQCWERMLYIQNICISAFFLYLNIYSGLPWKAVGVGVGVRGVWTDVIPPFIFKSRIRSIRNTVGKLSQLPFCPWTKIHPTSSSRHFLPALSILWQCKGILSSKKYTKAASRKSLCQIKFIFTTPPQLFRYKYATA